MENQFVQKNILTLQNSGFYIAEPEEGDLACGYQGKGRMAEPEIIMQKITDVFNQQGFLKGKKIVITTGGTKENIDLVRYIGNHSSGKMGIAIADAAYYYGADVILISTVNCQKPYKVVVAESAQEMLKAAKKEFLSSDAMIMAAAVADYRPKEKMNHKIKKESQETLTVELVKNPDILMEISNIKTEKQIVIGFCAESESLIENAKKKIRNKNLDFIVANDISKHDTGFNSDYNAITIINKDGIHTEIPKTLKLELAKIILKKVFILGH